MRFAYADPPYLGRGRKDYTGDRVEGHPDGAVWDDPAEHARLCERLVDEYPDGWVVSLLPSSLGLYLNNLPGDVRIGAYCKTWHQIRVNVAVQYAWEPVIFRGGRQVTPRAPMVRDWMPISTQDSGNRRDGFKGSKPGKFNRWVLDLLGYEADKDTLDDLFPGTGGMGHELAQGVLL